MTISAVAGKLDIQWKAELGCATLGLELNYIVEEVIDVDEFDKVKIGCSMKVRQIREGWAELC